MKKTPRKTDDLSSYIQAHKKVHSGQSRELRQLKKEISKLEKRIKRLEQEK